MPNQVERIQNETNEGGNADEAEDGGDHETARASEDKPEQGAKDLAAIERINGKDVKDQERDVYPQERTQQHMNIGHGLRPTEATARQEQRVQDWQERDIDERSGGDAPQSCAGARRRV